MRRIFRDNLPLMAVFFALASSAAAQQKWNPRIAYVYPAGGKQGSTFQVVVGGQYLMGANAVSFSGKGATAKFVDYYRPLSQKEINDLRERLKALMEDKKKDQSIFKEIAEIREKLAKFIRKPNPAMAERVTIEVTLADNAELGLRELRLLGPRGLTNPVFFRVGQLAETAEPPAESTDPNSPIRQFKPKIGPSKDDKEKTVALPVVINGQITPGDVDRYRFRAQKGQRIVAVVSARELLPYLPDGVPGWFQATLALYDAAGKELVYADDYRFHPDPVLSYLIPADGEYVVEIRDAIYRGREDFVYRIALGELPFVTGIFPLGGPAGKATNVQVRGWNLPAPESARTIRQDEVGVYPVSVTRGSLLSNQEPFAVNALQECLDREPNNMPPSAQALTLPIIVNGRIDQADDRDVFRFEGKAGQRVVAEVMARRLDSPVDSLLKLTDSAGKTIATNDDHEDKGSGLNTHHADSYLVATLPADGTYYLHLSDVQRKGGPEYAYRLRVSPPQGDFELRVVPSSVSIRAGSATPLTVYALRKDGFAGEIELSLKDAPDGFALRGAQVPAGQDQVKITLTAPSRGTGNEPVALQIEGRAKDGGRVIIRPATPAEDMEQAFAYHHLVPVNELKVAAPGGGGFRRPTVKLVGPTPVKIPAGGTARVMFDLGGARYMGNLKLALTDPPAGLSVKSVSPVKEGMEVVLQADPTKSKPGMRGNLVLEVFTNAKGPFNKSGQRRQVAVLPAFAFEVVGK